MLIDNPNCLLYIHPDNPKTDEPLNDDITTSMEKILNEAISAKRGGILNKDNNFVPGFATMGVHFCQCGAQSSNKEYQLFNGMTTNTLCVHYLQYHRVDVPESEMDKVRAVVKLYNEKQ